jgi:serine/threonine protein kinase
LVFPDHVSSGAKKFLNKIFQKDPERRLTAKEILKDPWIDISNQELEMLSPRHAHGFANNSDLINYERVAHSMN